MPSNFTQHFNLSQWEPTDQVLREDFNADNAKIDAALARKGNCQVIMGSYTGTGKFGEKNPTTITFSKKPLVVIVIAHATMVAAYGVKFAWIGGIGFNAVWTENTFSWYLTGSEASASNQLNEAGKTYQYLLLVEA